MIIELLTSLDAFDELHQIADGKKAVVKVDREYLHSLLLDHSAMINALQNKGVICRDPTVFVRRMRLQE
jgi:hypothetical protein